MTLPTGIYCISVWGSHEQPQVLTIDEENITLSPPSAKPSRNQEWRVEVLENGNVAIQNPANIFPSRSLSYRGEEPKPGERVVLGPVSDFPTREWRVEPAPQRPLPVPYFIRVPDEDLIAAISPLKIFPPQIALRPSAGGLDNAWVFELVRPE